MTLTAFIVFLILLIVATSASYLFGAAKCFVTVNDKIFGVMFNVIHEEAKSHGFTKEHTDYEDSIDMLKDMTKFLNSKEIKLDTVNLRYVDKYGLNPNKLYTAVLGL